MERRQLTFQQLQELTDGFSERRKLGEGAYGKVYWAKDEYGREIAIKLFHNNVGLGLPDKEFQDEFDKLKKLNHTNIVKLIGYCYDTQHRFFEYNGKTIFAEETRRVLCLEYMCHWSLKTHLSKGICDARLDWNTSFKIIKGACEGLKYLHEELKEPIYHLDLKPDNILLDVNMVPKLGDFGLSRIFGGEETQITNNRSGTIGYMPPEYIHNGVISKMFDIFSMGVVMLNTISGLSGRSMSAEMSAQEFIDKVQDSWRVKLLEKWNGAALEAYCQQVKRCTEIALKCVEVDKKNRPTIVDIVRQLRELETEADEISRCPGGELLSVYPSQLVFPSKLTTCAMHLTNNTDHAIQYKLSTPWEHVQANDFLRHANEKATVLGVQTSGLVPARATHTSFLTVVDLPPRSRQYEFLTLKSWRLGERNSRCDQLKLVALYYEPPQLAGTAGKKGDTSQIKSFWCTEHVIDVHPTQPLVLVASKFPFQQLYGVTVYKCDSKKIERIQCTTIELPRGSGCCLRPYHYPEAILTSVKFLARKDYWIVMSDSWGALHSYCYNRGPEEMCIDRLERAHSKSIESLAVHPTKPYLLSASKDGCIKLWDYENGLKLLRVFGSSAFFLPWQDSSHVYQNHVVFNPKDGNTFTSVQNNRIKIWNLDLSECTFTSDDITRWNGEKFLNYFSRGNQQQYLIAYYDSSSIKIWNIQSMECVETLGVPYGGVRTACSHPDLPILFTGNHHGNVYLWNSNTLKIECVLYFGLGPVLAVGCLKGSRWIVIAHSHGIAFTEIGTERAGAGSEGTNELEQKEIILYNSLKHREHIRALQTMVPLFLSLHTSRATTDVFGHDV